MAKILLNAPGISGARCAAPEGGGAVSKQVERFFNLLEELDGVRQRHEVKISTILGPREPCGPPRGGHEDTLAKAPPHGEQLAHQLDRANDRLTVQIRELAELTQAVDL
ncbi:MAG: hypothetical protein KJ579_07320 [Verrucomicrobia bacterium]|nr:hypothetical protein [Verrucomicrobiota bacterium]